MKIVGLIQCLSNSERGEIRSILSKDKRKTLQKAFEWILKKGGKSKADKAGLYKAVYNKKYAESKDYLLRNELRLLTLQIEQFIIKKRFDTELRNGSSVGGNYLLERYKQSKSWNLYEKEWRKQYKFYEGKKDWGAMARLLNGWTDYLRKTKEISVELFEEIDNLTTKAIRFESLHAQELIRKTELQKAFANRHLKAFIPTHEMPEINYGLFFTPQGEDEILEYIRLRVKSYKESGDKKLEIIQRLIELYPTVSFYRKEYKNDIYLLWGTVGLEHFLMANYEAAHAAYEKAFDIAAELKLPFNANLFYNMVSNLMKLERYEELVTSVRKKLPVIRKNKSRIYRFEYLLAMSHIFLGEHDAAYRLIHQSINKRPESEYYNFRFLYAICFYLMEDEDRFEREINNINQKIKYQPPVEEEYPALTKLFSDLIKLAYYTPEKEGRKKIAQSMRRKIKGHSKHIPLFDDFFITKWLLRELTLVG